MNPEPKQLFYFCQFIGRYKDDATDDSEEISEIEDVVTL